MQFYPNYVFCTDKEQEQHFQQTLLNLNNVQDNGQLIITVQHENKVLIGTIAFLTKEDEELIKNFQIYSCKQNGTIQSTLPEELLKQMKFSKEARNEALEISKTDAFKISSSYFFVQCSHQEEIELILKDLGISFNIVLTQTRKLLSFPKESGQPVFDDSVQYFEPSKTILSYSQLKQLLFQDEDEKQFKNDQLSSQQSQKTTQKEEVIKQEDQSRETERLTEAAQQQSQTNQNNSERLSPIASQQRAFYPRIVFLVPQSEEKEFVSFLSSTPQMQGRNDLIRRVRLERCVLLSTIFHIVNKQLGSFAKFIIIQRLKQVTQEELERVCKENNISNRVISQLLFQLSEFSLATELNINPQYLPIEGKIQPNYYVCIESNKYNIQHINDLQNQGVLLKTTIFENQIYLSFVEQSQCCLNQNVKVLKKTNVATKPFIPFQVYSALQFDPSQVEKVRQKEVQYQPIKNGDIAEDSNIDEILEISNFENENITLSKEEELQISKISMCVASDDQDVRNPKCILKTKWKDNKFIQSLYDLEYNSSSEYVITHVAGNVFCLPFQLCLNDITKLKLDQQEVLYNMEIPAPINVLYLIVGVLNRALIRNPLTVESLMVEKKEQQMHFLHYFPLQGRMPLNIVGILGNIKEKLLIEDIIQKQLLIQQYYVSIESGFIGIGCSERKTQNFWKRAGAILHLQSYVTGIVPAHYVPIEIFAALSQPKAMEHYYPNDFKNTLSQQQQDCFIRNSVMLQMNQKLDLTQSNIVMIDFEFSLAQSTFAIPYEVGLARVQNGQLVATYHAFLEPLPDTLRQIPSDLRVNFVLQPYSENSRALGAIQLHEFEADLLRFISSSSDNMPNHSVSFTQFQQQDLTFISAKGVFVEKKVLEMVHQSFLAENIQEFESIMSNIKQQNVKIGTAELHNKQKDEHRCGYHALASCHCALNDVCNLVDMFLGLK